MAERKPISKKLRFEVFKRDNFTCQYCGKMAPDVILEVDHINPVAKGGKNEILNLVTSCADCNRGKGAKPLTDNQVIKQQQEQLKEINEKREQLKLMLKWKKELESFDNEQADIIDNMLCEATGCHFNQYGFDDIKKTIKHFGISEVIESTKLSISQYYDGTDQTVNKVFSYIPRICAMRKKQSENPWLYKQLYIKGIIKNRLPIYNNKRLTHMLNELVDCQEHYEDICNIAREAKNWSQFWQWINEVYKSNY